MVLLWHRCEEPLDITLGPQNLTEVTSHPRKWLGLGNTEIFIIFLYVVILVMGVIGNGLVIFVTSYKMKMTVNSNWFLSLAIADFIFILFLIFCIIAIFHKNRWPFGDFMCKYSHFLKIQNMFASVFFLTVISLDRCLCTWMVVWAQNKRTLVKARIICMFVWLSSICFSIPFAIAYSVQEHNGFKYCALKSFAVLLPLTTFRFMVGFLVPFFIILSSYIAIGVRVKSLKSGNRLRPFRVISVILVFLICWFPFHVVQLTNWNLKDVHIETSTSFITGLIYLNSCLNPILYVFMCEEFNKKIKTSLLLVLETAFTEDHLVSY